MNNKMTKTTLLNVPDASKFLDCFRVLRRQKSSVCFGCFRSSSVNHPKESHIVAFHGQIWKAPEVGSGNRDVAYLYTCVFLHFKIRKCRGRTRAFEYQFKKKEIIIAIYTKGIFNQAGYTNKV